MSAASGRQSKDSMQASYTAMLYLVLPGEGRGRGRGERGEGSSNPQLISSALHHKHV